MGFSFGACGGFCGTFFGTAILYNYTNRLDKRLTFLIAGLYVLLSGIILLLIVKDPHTNLL